MKKHAAPMVLFILISLTLLRLPVRAEEPLLPEYTLLPISKVQNLPADTPGVAFRGTVVWSQAETAIVQDGEHSIRLFTTQSLFPGDLVLIRGQTGQDGFSAEEVVREGTGPLPAMEAALPDPPEEVRIVIRGGWLAEGILTQNGQALDVWEEEPYTGTADVYGIVFDGILYADAIVPIQKPREWTAFFGLLDAHSDLSDGLGTVQEAFSAAAQVEGLDFFAVTDHSSCLNSAKWEAGKQAAAAVTNERFVGIFGYEMTWGEDKMVGHINTFATDRWLAGAGTLAEYCAALAGLPGQISQFNHPGVLLGDFGGFQNRDPYCDAAVQLLQVEGEGGESFYPYYIQALDESWHVAPTVGQDNHHGSWGADGLSRTAVLAKELSENALYEAMAARRVYATQDPDLFVDYRLNGNLMGSVIGMTEGLEAGVFLDDPTDGPEALVEVIGSGGAVLAWGNTADGTLSLPVPDGFPYYFLRVTQPDGDVAVTAPVWVDDFADMGIGDFRADTDHPLAGQTVILTLELYNREEIPFQVTAAAVYRDAEHLGYFSADPELRYTFPLLWENPGEVELTAVVQGTVNGMDRCYERALTLHFDVPNPENAAIRQARDGLPGTVFAVEGYATSGNTNPGTTFPDTIYIQDDTGGIPVRGRFPGGIQVGTPLAVTGVLREGSEDYLELTDCRIPERAMYRYVPQALSCRDAADYAQWGGSLIQVEGTVTDLTSDRSGVSRFTVTDSGGSGLEVRIDPEIRSGAYGVNALADTVMPDQTIRVIGLLSREENGQPFLRVRNCDEVVSVSPVPAPAAQVIADESNPPTGDSGFWCFFTDILR